MNYRQRHLRRELTVTWLFSWILFLATMGLFITATFLWDWRYALAGFVTFLGNEATGLHEKYVLEQLDC